ncbi:hypothetical protein LCGC14_0318520 [marine sediment metagenome]|uniref:Uncharacterized protein n=1 Tax=marine sediment metagenome TaxID=412755 RepID=A0A0F9TK27_9ZZZZ
MLKQTLFRIHRGINIYAGSIIICGHCEMPIWRMTADLASLQPYTGYHGIPRQFITTLDGRSPDQLHLVKGQPCWSCPECEKYVVQNTAVFFEMPPHFACSEGSLDPSLGHRLRFFVDYEGIR